MSTFHSAVEEFSELTTKYGFFPATSLWEDHFVSLVKRIKEFTFCYVLARRDSDGEYRTDLFVAQLDYPDDRLMKHPASFHIEIGDSYKKDPEFFLKCEKRIINVIPALELLADASINEMKNPSFYNDRVRFYYHIRKIFDHILFKHPDRLETLKNKDIKFINKELTKNFSTFIADINNDTYNFISEFKSSILIQSLSPLFYINSLDKIDTNKLF